MVEQDVKQASPAFSDLQNSNDKYQSFETNSIKCMNNDQLSSLLLNDDNIDLNNELPDEELLFSDCSTNEHTLNKKRLDGLWQPLADMYSSPSDPYFEASSPLSIWSPYPLDLEAMKIDEVFQVDKDDIFHSPTLAELNANDESLFDSFDCFDGFFPSGNKIAVNKSDNSDLFNLPEQPKQILLANSSLEKEFAPPPDPSLLKQDLNLISTETDSVPKPTQNDIQFENVPASMNEKKKPEKLCITLPNKRIKTQYEEETVSKVESLDEKVSENSHLSSSSNIDQYDSEEDSDFEGDYSTDADEESDDEIKSLSCKYSSSNRINLEKKKSRYFWQYNMQSKGPKGPKMKLTNKLSSVHDLPGVSDPVFSASCPIEGVKHSGKARRGDGNDLTPNPKKLYNIGVELEKLNSLIDGLVPVNELPVNARTKSRKEKNKLASRACRLKKKAQHEANKLKLYGLQQEQKGLLKCINEIKKVVKSRVQNIKLQKDHSAVATIETMQINKGVIKVAGCSADFVNNVLKAVSSGDDCGGLHIPLKREN